MEALQDRLQQLLEGKIDFEGQKQVEQTSKAALIGISVLSFTLGFLLQDIRVTFAVFGVCTILLLLYVVPPWPMYNRHPVPWLPSTSAEKSQSK